MWILNLQYVPLIYYLHKITWACHVISMLLTFLLRTASYTLMSAVTLFTGFLFVLFLSALHMRPKKKK